MTNNLSSISLIDTHTHFDMPVFAEDRMQLAVEAWQKGIRHLLLVGYLAKHFNRLYDTQQMFVQSLTNGEGHFYPKLHLVSGLHPAYIEQHNPDDIVVLADFLRAHQHIALGEIGLDTFNERLKATIKEQEALFIAQLDLAVTHGLPVLLHIRKAHAQALKILKKHRYDAHQLGGIAHSFSGGEQEAKSFVKLGFKLGVTGQVTNPNAKKLRRAICAAVQEYGVDCLVLETDCPDMLPVNCQPQVEHHTQGLTRRNVPANLIYVLSALSEILAIDKQALAQQLWHNSCHALQVKWTYPLSL